LSDRAPCAIAIAGVAGRMGQALLRAALDDPAGFQIAGATERPGSLTLGRDVGELVGRPRIGVTATPSVEQAAAHAAVWVDFTTPQALSDALARLDTTPVRALVVGTTGLDTADEAALAEAARRVVVVRSGNFSMGVNVLAGLVRRAARALGPDWDIEILETHHRRKVDAPSGTALLLARAAAEGRGGGALAHEGPGRTGARGEGSIGFAVRRGGGVVGEHEVAFLAEAESVRLTHIAADRGLFARGALAAAHWALGDVPPGLYGMDDVLFGPGAA